MDRLTRVQIIEAFRAGRADVKTFNALCNMALQSLSQEAVRDEALEMPEDAETLEWEFEFSDTRRQVIRRVVWREDYDKLREFTIRALKREPNAAAAEGPAHGLPCWPVDRPAPAVVELIAQLRDMAFALEKQGSEHWAMNCGYAAALLAKLGQGWIPSARFRWGNNGMVADPKGGYIWIGAPGASDE